LASAESTSDFQSQILLVSACTADTQFDMYLADWQVAQGPLSPSDPLPVKQLVWDNIAFPFNRGSAISDSSEGQIFGSGHISQQRLAVIPSDYLLWAAAGLHCWVEVTTSHSITQKMAKDTKNKDGKRQGEKC